MFFMTSCSKHFVMIGVSATGQKSLRQDTGDFIGRGMMVVVLKHTGITSWLINTLPEYPAMCVVRTSSFPWVSSGQSFTEVYCRQAEYLVYGRWGGLPYQHIVLCINPCKEIIQCIWEQSITITTNLANEVWILHMVNGMFWLLLDSYMP